MINVWREMEGMGSRLWKVVSQIDWLVSESKLFFDSATTLNYVTLIGRVG
jgi:hypothetical protein